MRLTLRIEARCSCFRRSTTLLVVLGEWLLLSKKPTPQGFVSLSAYEGTAYSTCQACIHCVLDTSLMCFSACVYVLPKDALTVQTLHK